MAGRTERTATAGVRPRRVALALAVLAGSVLAFGVASPARSHGGALLVLDAVAVPEAVVVEGGAPSPAGETFEVTVLVLVDDLDPGMDLRISSTDFDMTTDLQALQVRIGAPGENGPMAYDALADPFVAIGPSFVRAVWTDSDEDLGMDGMRDPEDTIAFSDALAALTEGRLYVVFATNDYPAPQTAAVRAELAPPPRDFVVLGSSEGRVATGADGPMGVQAVQRVFAGELVRNLDAGGPWSPVPRVTSSSSPAGADPLAAGSIRFDIVPNPATGTGRALHYWTGSDPVVFAEPPAGQSLVLSLAGGGGQAVVDGQTGAASGFVLGATMPDGSGLDATIEARLSPDDESAPSGVYALSVELSYTPSGGPTLAPSEPVYLVWGRRATEAALERAVAEIEAVWVPEPAPSLQAGCALLVLMVSRKRR